MQANLEEEVRQRGRAYVERLTVARMQISQAKTELENALEALQEGASHSLTPSLRTDLVIIADDLGGLLIKLTDMVQNVGSHIAIVEQAVLEGRIPLPREPEAPQDY
jgi:hypothetical protein